MTENGLESRSVWVLRDTGANQSLILRDVLPLPEEAESSVLVKGIGKGFVSVPLHKVHLGCELVTGTFKIGISSTLPIKGVDMILGNVLSGVEVESCL